MILQCLCGPLLDIYVLDGYEKVLRDELVNWDFLWTVDRLMFDHVAAKHVPIIEEIMALKNYKKVSYITLKCFTIPREKALDLFIE